MKQFFCLPFLLVHLAGTGSSKSSETCSFKPEKVIWRKSGQTAVLCCDVTCSDANPQWFSVKESSHQRLQFTGRYKLVGNNLHIASLNVNDTGTYYCAVTKGIGPECCFPCVGNGTTLKVRDRTPTVWNMLLWLSFTLLAIYSLALVTLIFLRKHGCNLTLGKKRSKTETQNSLRKKTQFQDVLQELHSRVNVTKRKQSTRGNGSQVEAASVEGNISTDDIYQNV